MAEEVDRFLAKLKDLGPWKLVPNVDQELRVRNALDRCPMEAVADRDPGWWARSQHEESIVRTGLTDEAQWLVQGAADHNRDHDVNLRARLLEACGLRS